MSSDWLARNNKRLFGPLWLSGELVLVWCWFRRSRGHGDVRMIPLVIPPTTTNRVPDQVTSLSGRLVPDAVGDHVVPSCDVTMAPPSPTATYPAPDEATPLSALAVPDVRGVQVM